MVQLTGVTPGLEFSGHVVPQREHLLAVRNLLTDLLQSSYRRLNPCQKKRHSGNHTVALQRRVWFDV
jgi:hypothetical protein